MQTLSVTQKHEGLRLDHFLSAALKVSRKKAKQLIDQGRIFLGPKKIIIASWKMEKGQEITLRDAGDIGVPRRERYLKVYFEDPDLLVVEKPPGVACERSAQTLTSTIVDDINDYLRRAHPVLKYPYVGLMHRLDRETSGLMVYTLSKRGNALAEQFKRHTVGRRYLALVEGNLPKDGGRIETALVKDVESQGKKMKALSASKATGATRAVTEYQVVERYGPVTLVEAKLLTGKTHQVRAHLAHLGHPIVGDALYGSRRAAPRHLLHAAYLEVRHPVTQKKLAFRSKPPKDFKEWVERLRAESSGTKKGGKK